MKDLLRTTADRAARYLASLKERSVAPTPEALANLARLDEPLPERPADPSAVIVGVWKPFKQEKDKLIYGAGVNPYVNLVDEKDIPVPAFGPIDLEIPR